MLTVDQFARIRQLRRDGLTIRQVAEQLHHSPKTILTAFANAEPVPVRSASGCGTPVYRDWQLPAALADLRREFEERLGAAAGVRHFIRVLQLLAHHPVECVEGVILAGHARVRPDPQRPRG